MKPRRLTIIASTLAVAILLLPPSQQVMVAIEQATLSAIQALPVINNFESGLPAGTDLATA